MIERLTITIKTDMLKELRKKQSDYIRKHSKSCSFSKIIDLELRKALKL